MRWEGRRQSGNVQDLRGSSGGFGGFGGRRGPAIGGGLGLGGIILLLIFTLLGGGGSLGNLGGVADAPVNLPDTGAAVEESAEEAERRQMLAVVLAETEDTWTYIFEQYGLPEYEPTTLVLYRDAVNTACGTGTAQTGPFYCPGDRKVYIDLSFYDELADNFGASGDFAMAYVLAHEVGHHVQTLTGISEQVNNIRNSRISEKQSNELTRRMELQADYLAGVWAHHANRDDFLEEGDFQEALNAAAAVGDDTIQRNAQGYVVPDSFTHGTSEQRMRWFTKGFEAGDLSGWDTFDMDIPVGELRRPGSPVLEAA